MFITCVAVWGLDEHGYFKTGEEHSQGGVLQRLGRSLSAVVQMGAEAASETTAASNVADRVLTDLKEVQIALLAQQKLDTDADQPQRSNQDKGKLLLFLFQRDLLPGISGKILESKGQRDNIAVKAVAWRAKVAGWTFIGLLNVGMLFYVLLFAVSQTTHRQGAWALSFLLWLVVEILLVSSAMVLFTHVFIPSLIMKDVNKIKLKLANSIRAFNQSVRNRHRSADASVDPACFNAASYLFVSTRLAQQWPELREAQIIAQFRTPWPKQSYQREVNVSKSYSKKYAALSRSASIIAIFFLTNLLQIPPALQDMVIQMCTTAVVGYTVLLHVDLFQIFPVLVIIPTLLVCVVVHFIVQSNKAAAKRRLEQMHPAADSLDQDYKHASQDDSAGEKGRMQDSVQDGEGADLTEGSAAWGDGTDEGGFHLPVSVAAALRSPARHITRKQSVQHGLRTLDSLKAHVTTSERNRGLLQEGESKSEQSSVGIQATAAVPVHTTAQVPAQCAPMLEVQEEGEGQEQEGLSASSSSEEFNLSEFSSDDEVYIGVNNINKQNLVASSHNSSSGSSNCSDSNSELSAEQDGEQEQDDFEYDDVSFPSSLTEQDVQQEQDQHGNVAQQIYVQNAQRIILQEVYVQNTEYLGIISASESESERDSDSDRNSSVHSTKSIE